MQNNTHTHTLRETDQWMVLFTAVVVAVADEVAVVVINDDDGES